MPKDEKLTSEELLFLTLSSQGLISPQCSDDVDALLDEFPFFGKTSINIAEMHGKIIKSDISDLSCNQIEFSPEKESHKYGMAARKGNSIPDEIRKMMDNDRNRSDI